MKFVAAKAFASLLLGAFNLGYAFKILKPLVRFQRLHVQQFAARSSESWDFLDAVYLITTTQTNNQRLARTKAELEKVEIWDRVKVKSFKPDDEDRVRGCYTSHISVLQEIQNEFKGRKDYRALVLEDNLETTLRMSPDVIYSAGEFLMEKSGWDVFHLAYMMYVPGLSLNKLISDEDVKYSKNVVQMLAGPESCVGTSAYVISKSGVDTVLKEHAKSGYKEAIPNVMAAIFPQTRYAAYPMVFHRAAKVGSLVNPQLDDFRKIMFSPIMYTTWERLMVSTGLQNNQLFPAVLISLLVTILASVYAAVTAATSPSAPSDSVTILPLQLLVAGMPLGLGFWGATLFKPGNSGAGFAPSAQKFAEKK